MKYKSLKINKLHHAGDNVFNFYHAQAGNKINFASRKKQQLTN